MQRDSISDSLTKEDIVAYIEAELNADISHELCFILVEGASDVKFVRRVFAEHVVPYESFAGKNGLTELIEDSSIRDERVIAVRDRDYVDPETLPERMFVYDTCCLEMMLLKNRDVVQGFCSVYCEEDGSGSALLQQALRALSPYSVARRRNEEQGLGINFEKAGFGDLVQRGGEFPVDLLFDRVRIPEELRAACREEACELSVEELYEITNGHDICRFLGGIADEGNGKILGEAKVRNVLLCSYRKEDFRQTGLYDAIRTYQTRYGLYYVE